MIIPIFSNLSIISKIIFFPRVVSRISFLSLLIPEPNLSQNFSIFPSVFLWTRGNSNRQEWVFGIHRLKKFHFFLFFLWFQRNRNSRGVSIIISSLQIWGEQWYEWENNVPSTRQSPENWEDLGTPRTDWRASSVGKQIQFRVSTWNSGDFSECRLAEANTIRSFSHWTQWIWAQGRNCHQSKVPWPSVLANLGYSTPWASACFSAGVWQAWEKKLSQQRILWKGSLPGTHRRSTWIYSLWKRWREKPVPTNP